MYLFQDYIILSKELLGIDFAVYAEGQRIIQEHLQIIEDVYGSSWGLVVEKPIFTENHNIL